MVKPNREIEDLHPIMRPRVRDLMAKLAGHVWKGDGGHRFTWAIFEGYRPAEVQQELIETTKSTKVGPWHSAHQYGLAVDIVPCRADDQGNPTFTDWSWAESHPWAKMHVDAIHSGLEAPIAWDQPHVQHPVWSREVPHGRA